nr:MAG TPA: Regulatory protein [Caudoviricetes sp.]
MELNVKKLQLIMARKEVGVRELATKASISAAAVSKCVRGITKPSIKSLGKIANALGVDVEEIIEDEKEKEQTR